MLITAEILARQLYFRSPWLMRFRSRRQSSFPNPIVVDLADLKSALRLLPLPQDGLCMFHTSVAGIHLRASDDELLTSPAAVANAVLRELLEWAGESRTVLLPTHPLYRGDDYHHGNSHLEVLEYDPRRTPSRVGLVSEFFRRAAGTRRSLHPLQTVACRGPEAEDLLKGNLNREQPLPHGVHSPYFRLCQRRGLVASIGVPLLEHMTLIHTAEDVRDAEWPIKGFFRERRFRVRDGESVDEWVVRERKPHFARSYCEGQLRRDFTRHGLIRDLSRNGWTVQWANAREIFDFLMRSNNGKSYPFFLATAAKLGTRD